MKPPLATLQVSEATVSYARLTVFYMDQEKMKMIQWVVFGQ